MKPSRNLTIFTVLVTLLLAVPALAWDEAKFQAQVQEMLDQAAAGFAKRDALVVSALSVPQASFKFQGGRTMSLEQWKEITIKEFADWREVKSKFVVEKVWPKGKGQAGAVYSERHEFSLASDPGHNHLITARFRVILTKTPQGWRFLEFTELGSRITRDGKPFSPKPAAK